MPGQHDHRRADAQPGRAHCKASEQHQRGGNLVPAGEVMLDQKARMKAELLSLDVEVEIVAESLARLGRKITSARLRRAEETEPHRLRPHHI